MKPLPPLPRGQAPVIHWARQDEVLRAEPVRKDAAVNTSLRQDVKLLLFDLISHYFH